MLQAEIIAEYRVPVLTKKSRLHVSRHAQKERKAKAADGHFDLEPVETFQRVWTWRKGPNTSMEALPRRIVYCLAPVSFLLLAKI